MAKRILDIGRVLFLIDNKKKASLLKYCNIDLSPENFVLIVNG
jgi:hypothetical protein